MLNNNNYFPIFSGSGPQLGLLLPKSFLSFQCFGWLGLNGAGKSTTFKMLTGELEPSSGSFTFGPARTRMGYCPQMDALDPHLTVREQIEVQCRIRGIRSKNISEVHIAGLLWRVNSPKRVTLKIRFLLFAFYEACNISRGCRASCASADFFPGEGKIA